MVEIITAPYHTLTQDTDSTAPCDTKLYYVSFSVQAVSWELLDVPAYAILFATIKQFFRSCVCPCDNFTKKNSPKKLIL